MLCGIIVWMTEKSRIFLFVVMLILVAVFPWWLSVAFLLVLTIYIPMYSEVVFFGFLFDSLYSFQRTLLPAGLTSAFVAFTLINLIRTQVRS